MTEEEIIEEIDHKEQYGVLSEECKKLKIDISSLQLSNRSLVNQNRDEKKKVMDCRLQIADLENRLKSFDATKQDLADSQSHCDRLRMTLESNEAKLADAERRAEEANGLIKIKDSIILKQSNFTKEMEERMKNVTEERDRLLLTNNTLETELNTALIRGEDADDLREKIIALQALFDKLVNERSDTTTESGLAAANEYFKAEEQKYENRIAKMMEVKAQLEQTIDSLEQDKRDMQREIDKQVEEYDKLNEKFATLEARIKEMSHSDRRYGGIMGSRLIGPTLPPWITDDKKIENDLERLTKADPATLRAKVMELESQLSELNNLLTYREDVILRIHEEISKKASKIEAAEVERSSLNAQVSILKRELSTAREDLARRGGGPAELEAEVERLRGKRDREYQRRKRIESELDEMEKENQELKQRVRNLEEAVANVPQPKPIPQSDPSDRNRIVELQGTVNQLRMDNEAKRSELFDLRSRLDTKSTQVDKIVAELKIKERSCNELTAQLNSARTQLESVTKELETVRCRAVRGGAEIERWHADLTSLQVTNKFLSSQLNEMRVDLLSKERLIAKLTKRCNEGPKVTEASQLTVNGYAQDAPCSRCLETEEKFDSQVDISERMKYQIEEANENLQKALQDKTLVESQLSSFEQELSDMKEKLLTEQCTSDAANNRVLELTSKINLLESSLTQTRTQLMEAKSDQRRLSTETLNNSTVSPPAKRTRRGAAATNIINNAKTGQECHLCAELRKQVQELEASLTECSSREESLTTQINELRQEIVQTTSRRTELLSESSAMITNACIKDT